MTEIDWWMFWQDDTPVLSGTALRHHLTVLLLEAGDVRTVSDLVRAIEREGFGLPGRPSKVVSDTLRWEVGHGRVRRLGRGRYVAGTMPKSTKSYIRKQVRDRRRRVADRRREEARRPFERWGRAS